MRLHLAPGPPRRRFVALCAAAFVALVVGVVVGAGGGGSSKPKPLITTTRPPAQAVKKAEALSLQRQIGEVLMIAFPGTTPPGYVQRALRLGRAGGVILFRANAPDPATTRSLTRKLQHAGHHHVLIATDQEGGPVRTLPWAAPQSAQSVVPTLQLAHAEAKHAARDLTAAGVNVTLAPVADVAGPGSVMRARAFPGGTTDVSALVGSAIGGYRGSKVAATLKHFPGLGEATQNTDDTGVTISSPRAAVLSRDIPAFSAGIKAGAPLVMASHALYTGIDPNNIASQSRRILTNLLRGKLGFKGVVITDSMEAAAVLKRSSIQLAALRSMNAGADLLLLTGPGSFPLVAKELTVAAKRSAKFRARIAQAAARVIALKRSLGLRSG
jgi:beta-N-acetylhexosaminidase